MNDSKNRTSSGNRRFAFGEFEVDLANRLLLRAGVEVPLTRKVMDILIVLVENPGRLLEKDDIIEKVWDSNFVEEGNLARNVSTLRKVLGDEGKPHKFIATVPSRGYRFVADVREIIETSAIDQPAEDYSILGSRKVLITAAAIVVALSVVLGSTVLRLSPAKGEHLFAVQPVFRRLTNSGRVHKVALSRDGNLVAFAADDREGETIFIRQTAASNEVALVPAIKGHVSGLDFSPDGNQIFYSVFTGDGEEGELHSVPILGGVSRYYFDVKVLDFTFAPDGHRFAAVATSRDRGVSELVIDELNGGEEKKLTRRSYPSDFSAGDQKVAWAPNGRSIAAVVNEYQGASHYATVILVDPGTGDEDKFTEAKWTYIDSVQWFSDSSSLIVSGSDGPGRPSQAWIVGLDGAARRITNDASNYSMLTANVANRSMIGIQTVRTSGIWSAPAGGTSAGLREIVAGSGNLSPLGLIGDSIVFRGTGISGSELWRVPMGGNDGEKRPLTEGASVDSRGLCATPDGLAVIFPSDRSGSTSLWRLELTDGSLSRFTFGENEIYPSCSPDGKWIVFQRMASANQKTSLWRVAASGGEPERITDYFGVRSSVSPDSRHVAFFYMDEPNWKLGIVSIDGGKIEQSFNLPAGMGDRIARWSPDGRSILLVGNYGDVGNIWRQSLDGGPAERVTDLNDRNIEDLIVSPNDGSFILSRSTTISDVFIATEQ